MWCALEAAVNKALDSVGGRTGAKFKIWTTATNIMAVLTSIIKQVEHRVSHQAYIKVGFQFAYKSVELYIFL